MRLIAVSDTHGRLSALEEVLERCLTADAVLFLGDGLREVDAARTLYPNMNIMAVRGNCDLGAVEAAPAMSILCAGEHKVLYTHGHLLGVKHGLGGLLAAARENGADIALFGHTHCRYMGYEDGIYVLNPGSAAQPRDGLPPSYGFVDLTAAGVVTQVVDLPW